MTWNEDWSPLDALPDPATKRKGEVIRVPVFSPEAVYIETDAAIPAEGPSYYERTFQVARQDFRLWRWEWEHISRMSYPPHRGLSRAVIERDRAVHLYEPVIESAAERLKDWAIPKGEVVVEVPASGVAYHDRTPEAVNYVVRFRWTPVIWSIYGWKEL